MSNLVLRRLKIDRLWGRTEALKGVMATRGGGGGSLPAVPDGVAPSASATMPTLAKRLGGLCQQDRAKAAISCRGASTGALMVDHRCNRRRKVGAPASSSRVIDYNSVTSSPSGTSTRSCSKQSKAMTQGRRASLASSFFRIPAAVNEVWADCHHRVAGVHQLFDEHPVARVHRPLLMGRRPCWREAFKPHPPGARFYISPRKTSAASVAWWRSL